MCEDSQAVAEGGAEGSSWTGSKGTTTGTGPGKCTGVGGGTSGRTAREMLLEVLFSQVGSKVKAENRENGGRGAETGLMLGEGPQGRPSGVGGGKREALKEDPLEAGRTVCGPQSLRPHLLQQNRVAVAEGGEAPCLLQQLPGSLPLSPGCWDAGREPTRPSQPHPTSLSAHSSCWRRIPAEDTRARDLRRDETQASPEGPTQERPQQPWT